MIRKSNVGMSTTKKLQTNEREINTVNVVKSEERECEREIARSDKAITDKMHCSFTRKWPVFNCFIYIVDTFIE